MRFSVPQYITIEDRLLGLVTFRQLFLVLGAFLVTYFSFKSFSVGFSLIVAMVAFSAAAILGWVTVNGRPLLNALPKVTDFFLKSRRYLWQPLKTTTTRSIEVPIIQKYFPPSEAVEKPAPILKRTPTPPAAAIKKEEKAKAEIKEAAVAFRPTPTPTATPTPVSGQPPAGPATAPKPEMAIPPASIAPPAEAAKTELPKTKAPRIGLTQVTPPPPAAPPATPTPPPPPIQPPQPLIRYIQYAHQHLANPTNPYRYFPLPTFPRRKW